MAADFAFEPVRKASTSNTRVEERGARGSGGQPGGERGSGGGAAATDGSGASAPCGNGCGGRKAPGESKYEVIRGLRKTS